MNKFIALLTIAAASLMVNCSPPDTGGGSYPLTTCVVSGESLGSMGDPYIVKYKGTEVRLCCKSCLKDFNKDPEKYVKMLNPNHDHSAHDHTSHDHGSN